MSNINDYLLWRGDIPINKKFKFNEIDSMILARFSYLLFSRINIAPKETIASISERMKNFKNEEFLYNGDKELITNLGESKRFKNMIVTDYVEINSKEKENQFSAITIHISRKEIYISFMGTDNTINGWKEDFNMAFMENVPCQIAGKEYIERISKKYRYKKIRIGGHSKGGNVAVYSAITANKKIQNKIIKIYNYDGTRNNKNTINQFENSEIINKIESYIPQDSIIGRLLNHKEKMTVILSTEKGILQHDIYSWQVLKDDLIKLEKNTNVSENIDKTLTDWLETTTVEQRKIFVDVVFELLYSTDANTFGEIYKNLPINITKILKKYSQTSTEDKKTITEMIKIMMSCYMYIIKKRENVKADKKYFIKFRKNKN